MQQMPAPSSMKCITLLRWSQAFLVSTLPPLSAYSTNCTRVVELVETIQDKDCPTPWDEVVMPTRRFLTVQPADYVGWSWEN